MNSKSSTAQILDVTAESAEYLEQDSWSEDPHASPSLLSVLGPLGLTLGLSLWVLPFLFGGRDSVEAGILKLVLYAACICHLAFLYSSFKKEIVSSSLSASLLSKTLLSFLPFLFYLGVQLIPLPIAELRLLSPFVAQAYSDIGASYGYLSLDPAASFSSASWILLCVLIFSVLLSSPVYLVEIHGATRRPDKRSRHKLKEAYFAPHVRKFDRLSEFFQILLIRLSVFCGFVALIHLGAKATSLFGVRSFDSGYIPVQRAHWPFVNANQLAIILEVGLLLSVSRLVRSKQLRDLTITVPPSSNNLRYMLLRLIRQGERYVGMLLSSVFLSFCLLLTMSRTGIVLTFVSLILIWAVYQFNPVMILPSSTSSKLGRGAKGMGIKQIVSKFILGPIVILFLLFSVLGERVDRGISYRFGKLASDGEQGRLALNSITKDVFLESPVFGVGLNSWSKVAPEHASTQVAGWKLDYAHNDYFQLVSEVGIVGLLCLMIPVGLAVSRFFRIKWSHLHALRRVYLVSLFLSFMTPVVHACFDFPYHLPMLSVFVLLSFVLFVRTLILSENTQDK